jgi:hypothetical protein
MYSSMIYRRKICSCDVIQSVIRTIWWIERQGKFLFVEYSYDSLTE